MSNQKQPFHKLLEQYVFKSAAQFIGQADRVTQDRIISLINDIHAVTSSPDTGPEDSSPAPGFTPTAESYEIQLEEQWQEALDQPVSRERIQQETDRDAKHLIALYQVRIEAAVLFIGRFQSLLKQSQNNIADEQTRNCLIHHYQSIIDNKAAYLITLKAVYEKELTKLQAH